MEKSDISDKRECPICKGTGKVSMKNSPTSDNRFSRQFHEEICLTCLGKGYLIKED